MIAAEKGNAIMVNYLLEQGNAKLRSRNNVSLHFFHNTLQIGSVPNLFFSCFEDDAYSRASCGECRQD